MYGTGARTIHGTGESLDDIVRRAALPISVRFVGDDYWLIWKLRKGWTCSEHRTERSIRRAYLRVCEYPADLLPAPPSSRAQPAGASAPALSFEPAAVTPIDAPAATLGVAPPSDAERPISSEAP